MATVEEVPLLIIVVVPLLPHVVIQRKVTAVHITIVRLCRAIHPAVLTLRAVAAVVRVVTPRVVAVAVQPVHPVAEVVLQDEDSM